MRGDPWTKICVRLGRHHDPRWKRARAWVKALMTTITKGG